MAQTLPPSLLPARSRRKTALKIIIRSPTPPETFMSECRVSGFQYGPTLPISAKGTISHHLHH